MEYLWQVHYDYNWAGLLTISITLALLYLGLRVAHRLLLREIAPRRWQLRLDQIVQHALLLFEPVVMLIILSYVVLIKPFFHGLIVLLLLVACFRQLRNYFSGIVLRYDRSLRVGTRLNHDNRKGLITYIGRLGLRLQTSKGLHFLNYDDLLKNGYTLLTGEKNSNFFRLKVSATDPEELPARMEELRELLHVAPYINWQHQPQVTSANKQEQPWLVEIALHDEKHLNDLILRMEEQNFSAKITKI